MLKNRYHKFQKFIQEELWFLDLEKLPPSKGLFYSFLRLFYIISHGLVRHNCGPSASALAFITLLYIVPLLAMIFSVAKGFNAQGLLQESLRKYTDALPLQIQSAIQQIFELVNQTDFTALGMIGFLILLTTILKSLSKIEEIFNRIWEVKISRPLLNKAGNYLLILLLVPVLIAVSSTMIASLSSDYLSSILVALLGKFYIIYELIIALSGILAVVSALTLLYFFLPNTVVRFSAAFFGGLVAGLIWYGIQWAYIKLQIGVTTYNAIYGVFATLPIFLFWLYLNWLIVLFGAGVSFAVQNYTTYVVESVIDSVNCNTRFRLACLVLDDICQHFNTGGCPWRSKQFQKRYNVPVHLLNAVLTRLVQEEIIVEELNHGYVPRTNPSRITMASAYNAILGTVDKRLPPVLTDDNKGTVLSLLQKEEEKFLQSLSKKSFLHVNSDEEK